MKAAQKRNIAIALEAYIEEHNLTQADVAAQAGVNAAYIINIRKGEFTVKSGQKTIDIATKYFKRIADFIGASSEDDYWQNRITSQLKTGINALNEAKENNQTAIIIGATGSGKTHLLNAYKKKHPKDFFVLKVGHTDLIRDLIDKTVQALRVETPYRSPSAKMRAICEKMKKLSEEGYDPALVFDESEYMKQPALCAMKEFYDNLKGIASVIMVGTPQLLKEINRLRKKDKPGIPQFVRRIKFNITHLPEIDTTYPDFLSDIKDVDLCRWLQKNCENYGELHDVIVRARRYAEKMNVPLSLELVTTLLKMN